MARKAQATGGTWDCRNGHRRPGLIGERLPANSAVAYRYRWQIELFFRWLKCVLGCRHLLSHCESGVTLQVYAAVIASLLISLWTGSKPSKRTWEMLCHYFSGWATLEELHQHLNLPSPRDPPRKS
ncbi:MAG: transposase [Planctomycetaceae bacterium]|nr:transposase [Planctomycetaceae bacterium]